MNVGIIFDTMDERGIKHNWLAERLGISRSLLSKYHTGSRPMPVARALRAAELLGLPATAVVSADVVDMTASGDLERAA